MFARDPVMPLDQVLGVEEAKSMEEEVRERLQRKIQAQLEVEIYQKVRDSKQDQRLVESKVIKPDRKFEVGD